MNSDWQIPNFGHVPQEYQREYFEGLVRQLSQLLDEMRSHGNLYGAKINLEQLPSSASGLRAGDVWSDGGALKIVGAVSLHTVTGASATGSVGTVSVTTS